MGSRPIASRRWWGSPIAIPWYPTIPARRAIVASASSSCARRKSRRRRVRPRHPDRARGSCLVPDPSSILAPSLRALDGGRVGLPRVARAGLDRRAAGTLRLARVLPGRAGPARVRLLGRPSLHRPADRSRVDLVLASGDRELGTALAAPTHLGTDSGALPHADDRRSPLGDSWHAPHRRRGAQLDRRAPEISPGLRPDHPLLCHGLPNLVAGAAHRAVRPAAAHAARYAGRNPGYPGISRGGDLAGLMRLAQRHLLRT